VDAKTGQALVQYTLNKGDADINTGPVVRQTGGTLTSIGTAVVDTDLYRIHILSPEYQVQALIPGHVIATADGHTSDIVLNRTSSYTNSYTVTPYPRAATAVPFATVKNTRGKAALALTSTTSATILLALPGTK
jgi:hypothetical protein